MQSRSLWWSSSGHLVVGSSASSGASPDTCWPVWLQWGQGVHQNSSHNLHSKGSQAVAWPFQLISSAGGLFQAIYYLKSWVSQNWRPAKFLQKWSISRFWDIRCYQFWCYSYPPRFMSLTLMAKTAGTMGTAVTAAYQVWDSCSFFSPKNVVSWKSEKEVSRWWIHLPFFCIVAFCYGDHCVQHLHDAHKVLANVIVLFGLFGDPLSQTAQTMLPSLLDRPSAKVLSGTPELWNVSLGQVHFSVSFGRPLECSPQARKLVKNLSVPWLMGSSQGIHSFLIDGIDRWVDIVAYVSLAVSQQRDNQLGGISTWSHLLVPSKEFPVGDGHAMSCVMACETV